jgi:gliding motility-associated-like protein
MRKVERYQQKINFNKTNELKYLFQILFLFSFSLFGKSQNLITNPSFEEIDSCYGNASPIGFDVFNWTGCEGWSCPTHGSSDLWCENPVLGVITPPQILGFGYQNPNSGKNFAGIYTFEFSNQKYREYIQNNLQSALLANQYYKFSIFVNTNEDSINYTSCLQAYFSDAQLTISNYFVLPVIPQWKNSSSNYIRDTMGWTLVTGIFKAYGGEKYVTIGCFDDSLNVVMKDKNPSTTSGIFHFIDDVKLELAPIEIEFPNVFTPTNDGINDFYTPKVIGLPDHKIYIYNRWGNLMTILDEQNLTWNGKNAKDGTYFYVLKSEEIKIVEQGFFQLIR